MAETIAPEEAFNDLATGMPELDKLGNEIIAAAQGVRPFGADLHRGNNTGEASPLMCDDSGPEVPTTPNSEPPDVSMIVTELPDSRLFAELS